MSSHRTPRSPNGVRAEFPRPNALAAVGPIRTSHVVDELGSAESTQMGIAVASLASMFAVLDGSWQRNARTDVIMQKAMCSRMSFIFAVILSGAAIVPARNEAAPPDQSESPSPREAVSTAQSPTSIAQPATSIAQPVVAVPTPVVIPDERKYWVGLRVALASSALRSQLRLGDVGLLVLDLNAGSPAHTAGFVKDDLLLDAVVGGTTIVFRQLSDLNGAVLAAARSSGPMQIKFLRNGEAQTRDVTPALRPLPVYGTSRRHSRVCSSLDDYVLLDWPMYAVTLRPPGLVAADPLPDNVSVTVTRDGSQPAKITVRRNLEEWTVSERELHKLPADLRPYVARMLTIPADTAPILQRPVVPTP